MTDALALHGPVGEYARAAAAEDFERMAEIALEIITSDVVVLPHPENPEVLCRCRSSHRAGLRNYLFLCDEKGENRWCVIQEEFFFQIYVTKEWACHVSGNRKINLENILENMKTGNFDDHWISKKTFGGLALSSSRPFHFFYDQLTNIPMIVNQLPRNRQTVFVDNEAFFQPDIICKYAVSPLKEKNHYYLTATFAGANFFRRRQPEQFFARVRPMEEAIAAAIPPLPLDPRPDLVLWLGITGQKRSWVEQVEGHVEILRRLAGLFPRMLVYIDGMTAPWGQEIENAEDAEVAAGIAAGLAGLDIRVVSLVGRDYAHKIARCHGIDAFVANGGTGCFVPLRICRKPGVLHSNRDLWTFRNDSYPDTVVFTDPEVVTERPAAAGQQPQFVSYSIAWQEIHNRLAAVLEKVTGVHVPQVTVPRAAAPTDPADPALFEGLSRQLGTRATPAMVLRDVALLFEKKGDYATALALMEQARVQNPKGPLIQRKCALYRDRLGLAPLCDTEEA